jgi:hypothetical protein
MLASVGSVTLAGCEGLAGQTAERTTPTRDDPDRVTGRGRTTEAQTGPSGGVTTTGDDGASAESNETNRGILVSNAGVERYVTVVVETQTGETVFSESGEVPADAGVRFPRAVSRPGQYRVIVETAAGERTTFEWDATPPVGDVEVAIGGRGVEVTQLVQCTPTCTPLSQNGTASGYPSGGFDPRGRRAGCEVRVRNDGDDVTDVRLRVGGATPTLDYRYRVLPTTTLVVPIPQRSGRTAVVVEFGDGERISFEWPMESEPTLVVRTSGRRTVVSR